MKKVTPLLVVVLLIFQGWFLYRVDKISKLSLQISLESRDHYNLFRQDVMGQFGAVKEASASVGQRLEDAVNAWSSHEQKAKDHETVINAHGELIEKICDRVDGLCT